MAAQPLTPPNRPAKKSNIRGILKVASLGVAGLIAGLLSA